MMNEATVQDMIRRNSAELDGGLLMRNNRGALKDHLGRVVRFGLGHTRPEERTHSHDLIGITPIVITPAMVGKTLGVFTSIECKKEGWTYRPNNEHERAQHKFGVVVENMYGIAGFANSVLQYREVITNFIRDLNKP